MSGWGETDGAGLKDNGAMIPRAERGLMMGWDNIYAINGNGIKRYLEGLLGAGDIRFCFLFCFWFLLARCENNIDRVFPHLVGYLVIGGLP